MSMFPLHCLVESIHPYECVTCALESAPRTVLVDSYAIITGDTPVFQLVDKVMEALGLQSAAPYAKGKLQVKNWKPLAFDQITDDQSLTVDALIKDISNQVTLNILTKQIPQGTDLTPPPPSPLHSLFQSAKDVLLRTALAQNPGFMSAIPDEDIKTIVTQLSSSTQHPHAALDQASLERLTQWCHRATRRYSGCAGATTTDGATTVTNGDQSPAATETAGPRGLDGNGNAATHTTKFNHFLEVPKLERWFNDNPNPSRTKLLQFMHTLNGSNFRKHSVRVSYQQICNWFSNARAVQRKQSGTVQKVLNNHIRNTSMDFNDFIQRQQQLQQSGNKSNVSTAETSPEGSTNGITNGDLGSEGGETKKASDSSLVNPNRDESSPLSETATSPPIANGHQPAGSIDDDEDVTTSKANLANHNQFKLKKTGGAPIMNGQSHQRKPTPGQACSSSLKHRKPGGGGVQATLREGGEVIPQASTASSTPSQSNSLTPAAMVAAAAAASKIQSLFHSASSLAGGPAGSGTMGGIGMLGGMTAADFLSYFPSAAAAVANGGAGAASTAANMLHQLQAAHYFHNSGGGVNPFAVMSPSGLRVGNNGHHHSGIHDSQDSGDEEMDDNETEDYSKQFPNSESISRFTNNNQIKLEMIDIDPDLHCKTRQLGGQDPDLPTNRDPHNSHSQLLPPSSGDDSPDYAPAHTPSSSSTHNGGAEHNCEINGGAKLSVYNSDQSGTSSHEEGEEDDQMIGGDTDHKDHDGDGAESHSTSNNLHHNFSLFSGQHQNFLHNIRDSEGMIPRGLQHHPHNLASLFDFKTLSAADLIGSIPASSIAVSSFGFPVITPNMSTTSSAGSGLPIRGSSASPPPTHLLSQDGGGHQLIIAENGAQSASNPGSPNGVAGGVGNMPGSSSVTGSGHRTRLMFDPLSEIPMLEKWFEENPHPSWLQIDQFTETLNAMPYRVTYPPITTYNVKIWFKNRRAKSKRLTGSAPSAKLNDSIMSAVGFMGNIGLSKSELF